MKSGEYFNFTWTVGVFLRLSLSGRRTRRSARRRAAPPLRTVHSAVSDSTHLLEDRANESIIFSFLFLFFCHKQLCVMVFINFVLCCLPLFSAELGAVVLLLSTFQKVQHIPYFLREEFGSKISRLP